MRIKVTCIQITDIGQRSQNSYTAPCNGVVSHGAPLLQMLLFPNALCCSLYERNCVCAVTKIFTKFLPANKFCQLLRVTRKRSCTFGMINRGRLELAISPIGGIRVFADHTRGKKTQTKCVYDLRRFTRVYFHAQTAVHTNLTNHGYFDRGKNPNTPNLSPMPG